MKFIVLWFYLFVFGVEPNFSWLIGVEFNGCWLDNIRVRIGVDVFDNNGVDSILFLSDKGPCIF